MFYNDLGQAPDKLVKRWTKTAIECYLNGLICSNCSLPKDFKPKCKMKPCVLELVKKFGKPEGKIGDVV